MIWEGPNAHYVATLADQVRRVLNHNPHVTVSEEQQRMLIERYSGEENALAKILLHIEEWQLN
jgi:hypothetical protein